MSVRRTLAAAVATALTASAVALSAGPASAAVVVDPDDTTGVTLTTADLIGVGSDTTQHAMKLFADAWNASGQAPVKMGTFAATSGGEINLPSGAITRPKNSGEGRAKLYGAGNNTDVDFARSSGAISPDEANQGLQMFPFALDTLVMAVSNSTASHAPASLTLDQVLGIYKGTYTNWSQLGGTSGAIIPMIPNDGSGTRSFFLDQLKTANGGVAVTPIGTWVTVQEHDPAPIMGEANAIAPFSKGRASLTNGQVRVEQGWSKDRAMYTVVRGADLANPLIQGAFGEDGALCSTAVRPVLAAAGFEQLATPDHGGVCGSATQTATTNFATNKQVVTTTKLTATSPAGKTAKLVAAVSGSTAPAGTFDFYEGATKVKASVPLVSSSATATLTGVSAGAHTYRAVFVPASGFDPSEATATVTVKALTPASISESFPAKVKLKKAKSVTVKGVVTVKGATGKVTVKKGKKTLKSASLKSGKASVKLPKLKKGTYKLTIAYAGDATHAAGTKSFTVKVVK